MAVRHLKWYASWVQNVVRQFGPYLPRAVEDYDVDRLGVYVQQCIELTSTNCP